MAYLTSVFWVIDYHPPKIYAVLPLSGLESAVDSLAVNHRQKERHTSRLHQLHLLRE